MNRKKAELIDAIEEYVCICEEMRELSKRHSLLKKRGIELLEELKTIYKSQKRFKKVI